MYIELHDSAIDNPKILKLCKDLKIPHWKALGHLSKLWLWVLRMAADGDISSYEKEDVEIGVEWDGNENAFYDTLIKRKFLDIGKDEFGDKQILIHDWNYYSGSLKTAQRVRKHRKEQKEKQLLTENVTLRNGKERCVLQASKQASEQASKEKEISTDPVLLRIPLKSGSDHPITKKDIDEYLEIYPNVDVLLTLKKISQWNKDNPTKQKTKSGIRRHISSWLSRDQDNNKSKNIGIVKTNLYQEQDPIVSEINKLSIQSGVGVLSGKEISKILGYNKDIVCLESIFKDIGSGSDPLNFKTLVAKIEAKQ